jgi:hypothetical protein
MGLIHFVKSAGFFLGKKQRSPTSHSTAEHFVVAESAFDESCMFSFERHSISRRVSFQKQSEEKKRYVKLQ